MQSLAKETGAHFNKDKNSYERNTSIAILPKRTVGSIIAIALIFTSISIYAFLRKPQNNGSVVYVPQTNYLRPPFVPPNYNHDSVERARLATLAAKKKVWKAKKAAADSAKVEPPKKKRKKFLGIF